MTTLIKAGCFRFNNAHTTKQLLENAESIIKQFKSKQLVFPQNSARQGLKIWALDKKKKGQPMEYSKLELAQMERETIGFYVTTHPILHLANKNAMNSKKYFEISDMENNPARDFYTVGILTDKVRTRKSRRGIVFNEIEIEDLNALIKLPVFGNKYEEILRVLRPGDAVAIKVRNNKGRLFPDTVKQLELEKNV
jgi:DNA polymerase III alpha subunit